jgi:hypothetical protein
MNRFGRGQVGRGISLTSGGAPAFVVDDARLEPGRCSHCGGERCAEHGRCAANCDLCRPLPAMRVKLPGGPR